MIVNIVTAFESYGSEFQENIYKSDGSKTLTGMDFNDLETGVESNVRYLYIRHDGMEPIYNVGFYIKPVGPEWGGYVQSSPDSVLPYNPNLFREGGVGSNNSPKTSSADYNFVRSIAETNPDTGCRLHLNRENPLEKNNSLGFNNIGTSLVPLILPVSTLDFSKSPTTQQVPGKIYSEPSDQSKYGKVGDEAKIGISLLFPEEVEGSGHVQFALAIKYRYSS